VEPSGNLLVVDNTGGTGGVGVLFRVNSATGARTIVSDFGNAGQGPTGARPHGIAMFAILGAPPPPPDLVVSALSAPAAAAAGANVVVRDTTKNNGPGGADPTSTTYYLSLNPTYEIGDVLLGSRSVPALGAGATSVGPRVVVGIPSNTHTGTYYVLARADADNQETESVETNNVRADRIGIGPDLSVPQFAGPTSAARGTTITVTDTTRNAPGAAGAPASTTYFYLSQNQRVNPIDVLLGTRAIPLLSGGQSSQSPTQLVIPSNTLPGPYFLIAMADGPNVVAEGMENNNFRRIAITIQ
jgi:subtilase family serine protease